MSTPLGRFLSLASGTVALGLLCTPAIATAQPTFTSPVFGLATAPDGSLLVADAGAGIVELRDGATRLIAPLPGVSDVAPIKADDMFAITGGGTGPGAAKLYRVVNGKALQVADLGRFEATVNPDPPEINPNPFDVAALGPGKALISDAGGNSLVLFDKGKLDWIATLPVALVSTSNIKSLFGCPSGPPDICGLPDQIPGQAVATSIAIGPDGAYYMGELKGFPAPAGESRVWRIEPGAHHATCGTSPDCRVVADGFTSIVDLAFGPDGTLYVVELDEASWFAVEVLPHTMVGGTVNACDIDAGTCTTVASGLTMPIAVTVGNGGELFAAVGALIPGGATVISLTP
jgi:hypothetical protein